MKKLLLLLFSLTLSFNSYGEWTEIHTNDEDTLYLDLNTIKENQGYIYWWNLMDMKEISSDGGLSGKVYFQGDCGITRTKQLIFMSYTQSMGKGEVHDTRTPENPEWNFQPPDSTIGFLLDTSCKLLNASEKKRQAILKEIQSKDEIQKLIKAKEIDALAKKELAYELQLELIDLQILIQEKNQEINKLDNLRASYKKDKTILMILELKKLIKKDEQKLVKLNNQIEEVKLLYKNEKYKHLAEVENELLELSLKREAAQQLFETEQYNRLLVEELQAEEELNKIILLKAYLERLKAAYVNNIAAKVKSLWRYQGAEDNWTADVYVLQDKDGKVLAVEIQKTNVGDSAKAKVFTDSIERAIYKSSPLPKAPDESIFTEEILFKFGVN
ncbi:MAG: hypothetical protein HOC15_01100 [Thiotrichales bacterium]|jgi:colicin import membrane protein|nr:hypothetical protein [Thiotrichales bacterium]